MATEVCIYKGKKIPKNSIIIEGFPSKGFVSTIAAKYMIDELDMELIGYIESDKLKSVAVIHNSKPMRPIRIYARGNVVVVLSELMIPLNHLSEFSGAVIRWLRDISPGEVVLLAGIAGKNTEKAHEIFGLANTDELNLQLMQLNVNRVEEGMLTGISSDLLLYCVENGIPAISLMTETKNLPDPLAAASMLTIVNKILGLQVDTQRLIDEGKKIETMFNDITTQFKRGKEGYAQTMENYPSMYM
jgi:uncharacterized protein